MTDHSEFTNSRCIIFSSDLLNLSFVILRGSNMDLNSCRITVNSACACTDTSAVWKKKCWWIYAYKRMRLYPVKAHPLRLYAIQAHAPICGVIGYHYNFLSISTRLVIFSVLISKIRPFEAVNHHILGESGEGIKRFSKKLITMKLLINIIKSIFFTLSSWYFHDFLIHFVEPGEALGGIW